MRLCFSILLISAIVVLGTSGYVRSQEKAWAVQNALDEFDDGDPDYFKEVDIKDGEVIAEPITPQPPGISTDAANHSNEAPVDEFDISQETPVATEEFELVYIHSDLVKDKINSLISGDSGQVEYSDNGKKILVKDYAHILSAIKDLIKSADRKIEVLIESQIVQVSLNEEQIRGIDWEAIVSHYHPLNSTQSINVSETRKLSAGIISDDDHSVLLEALETVGEVKILSSPSITIPNGKKVFLNLRSLESHVIMTMATPPSQPQLTPHKDLEDLDQRFYFTPKLLDYLIHSELSHHLRTEEILLTTLEPLPEHEGISIDLNVKKNDIVVIGGIFNEKTVESTKKFPLLGDIPLLGLAFRNQNTSIYRTEHIIFLMPKVIITTPDSFL